MKFCNNCKTPLDDSARFCPKCGLRQNQEIQPQERQSPKRQTSKSKGKTALLIIGILAVISAGIFCSFFLAGAVSEKQFEYHMKSGNRYLEEMKYEEAVVAFTAAIRIEPKRMEAYLSLADVYGQLGEHGNENQVLDTAFSIIREEYEEHDRQLEKSEVVVERLMAFYEGQGQDQQAEDVKTWAEKTWQNWKKTTKDDEDMGDKDGESAQSHTKPAETQQSQTEPESQPAKLDVTEEKLRQMLEAAADRQILEFIYCDLDKDGTHEAVAITGINEDELFMSEIVLWYIDGQGAVSVETGIDQMGFVIDFWNLYVVDAGEEQHVVLNGNVTMGSTKQCFTYRMENRGLQQVYDGYGEIFMRDGRLWFGVEDYLGMESDSGPIGHTWKNYPICYEDGSYKEYGGIEISRSFFMEYQNAAEVWQQMMDEVLDDDPQARCESKIWYRGNGLITVDCAVYNRDVYRVFSHAYMTVENNRVSLVIHEITDETGRVTDSYCFEGGMLEETGTGLPVIYPDAPEH